MDFFGTNVPTETVHHVIDQSENEESEEYYSNRLQHHHHHHQQQQQQYEKDVFESDDQMRKEDQFLSARDYSDSGDQVESVAMDLITAHQAERHPESQIHDERTHHTQHTTESASDRKDNNATSAVISSSLNVMHGCGRHAVDPVLSGNSSSSSPCSNSNNRHAIPTIKITTSSAYQRFLRVPEDGDKRLASSYPSFLLGRILSLSGSIFLLIGLFFRFIFMGEDSGPAKSIPFTIIGTSIAMIFVGASLVIWSAHKSQRARKLFSQGMIPSIAHPRDGRPQSNLSSTSYS